MRHLTLFVFSLFLISAPAAYGAQDVSLQASAQHVASKARYIDNGKDAPAILILHGFSATHNYPTVQSLQDFLSLSGYTTLAPTLSLNIPLRTQPVNCNSLHTHTLDMDKAEVQAWIQWLENQGHKKIILVGHSSGSQTLLEAMMDQAHDSVQALILTSLFYLSGEEIGNKKADQQRAEQMLAAGKNSPTKFNFLFCQNDYLATPESYLSYLTITRERVISTLNQVTLPTYVIMGSKDTRYKQVGHHWLDELAATQSQLIMIEGANHFFTGHHEGQLHDQIIDIIQQLDTP